MQNPAVTGVFPSVGASGGGAVVTVTGTGFQDALSGKNIVESVAFGSVKASDYTVWSGTQLTVTAPPPSGVGSFDVTVTTSKGTSAESSVDQFTYGYAAPTTTQVMMTLAALASTAAAERPSGEPVEQQAGRTLAGINGLLADTSLATAGAWTASWVGLTQDRANLVYIAQNAASNELAVCLRGTQADVIDILQDVEVAAMLPFMGGCISQGAMEAFTEIVMGTALVQALRALVSAQSTAPTIYVTGHSLGGALATTVSLYLANLAQQGWSPAPTFKVYTFAAPTAGDADFATAFNTQFPDATCVWNQYDAIPQAWQNLTGAQAQDPPMPEAAEYFYPGMGSGVTGGAEWGAEKVWIKGLIKGLAGAPGHNVYVQPQGASGFKGTGLALNTSFDCNSPPASVIDSIGQWLAQVGYQHANNTYLALMGAPGVPDLTPTITSLTPSSQMAGGSPIKIAGTGFTRDSVVDFGVLPAVSVSLPPDGTSITAVQPPGAGIVAVTVTNRYGTSSVVTSGDNPGCEDVPAQMFNYS